MVSPSTMIGHACGQDSRFRRIARLLNGNQFKSVFKIRQTVHGRFFSVHACSNEIEQARLGLAVSKKVSKLAVERNRIKRQVRESFRLRQQTLIHADFVVVAKSAAKDIDSRLLRSEIDQLWQKSEIKCVK